MTKEQKEELVDLLEDFMWEHEDAELTHDIIMLQDRIREDIE